MLSIMDVFVIVVHQQVKENEGETEEREEPEAPESTVGVYTAEKKRQLWRMAHYRTDQRDV